MREDGQRTGNVQGKCGQGSILLYEDFEGVGKWGSVAGWGGIGRYAYSGDAAYDKDKGLAISLRVIVPDGPTKCFMGRSFGYRTWQRMRVEFCFRGDPARPVHWFYMALEVIRKRVKYTAGVLTDTLTGVWGLADGTDSWVLLPEVTKKLERSAWHRWALEVDFAGGSYISLEADGDVYDLSGKSIGARGVFVADVAWVLVGFGTQEALTHNGHVDCVLVREI